MSLQTKDLLLEIGVEELPAAFVDAALAALPDLATKGLKSLRLSHGPIHALGTPRRLALLVEALESHQPDLEVEVTGPPVKAAFKDGIPTKAAEAFAQKLGCTIPDLRRVEGPKGDYLVGTRREAGKQSLALLPEMLTTLIAAIPFRKSMRWGNSNFAFGRPIHWLVALFGEDVIPIDIAGAQGDRLSRGHRFLAPDPITIASPSHYLDTLRQSHVLVQPDERATVMRNKLLALCQDISGVLIEDDFLLRENLSLVEEPYVILGTFSDEFLDLPEQVILQVAKGHQRYFGIRAQATGALLPNYLAVVNTAQHPDNIRCGNDRVMRARLSDARFFYNEDLKTPLVERRSKLAGIVFQKRLGTILQKADRMERLARELGLILMLPEPTLMAAASGAHLAKCDLVALMVGEFPELQGEMGRAYARAQGVDPDVADVIRDHYLPRTATDTTAPKNAGALVAIADRLDTLVGCFAIGLIPSGTSDPYGLRRACLGILRTLFDRNLDLRLSQVFAAAYDGYADIKLDLNQVDSSARLQDFFTDRLRGLLAEKFPIDVVLACLPVAADRPLDARARAMAIADLDSNVRARVGEVFKRATNIADKAPLGDPLPPFKETHPSEVVLYEAFIQLRDNLARLINSGAYAEGFATVANFAPLLHQYFLDVFVMTDDTDVRDNRLRLMRAISETCSTLAKLEVLGDSKGN